MDVDPLKEQKKKKKYKEKERAGKAQFLSFPTLLQVIPIYKKAKAKQGNTTDKQTKDERS